MDHHSKKPSRLHNPNFYGSWKKTDDEIVEVNKDLAREAKRKGIKKVVYYSESEILEQHHQSLK